MKRSFDEIMKNLKKSIAGFSYYTDFKKVYGNVEDVLISLNILNSLIGTCDKFDDKFLNIIHRYPETLKAIPILIAFRTKDGKVPVADNRGDIVSFDFESPSMKDDDYLLFVDKTGLKDMIANARVTNLVDYVTGVEVGLDSNARKNRTGSIMEGIVLEYLQRESSDPKEIMVQANKKDIISKWGYTELENINISEKKKEANKRFDFAINVDGIVFLIETNFYGSGGSKLNETSRSYEKLADDINNLKHYRFIWVTDGIGWKSARRNLEESYQHQLFLATLRDLETNFLMEEIQKYCDSLKKKHSEKND